MKSILITGGSGKIGFQLVQHFLKSNFQVVTTSRNKEKFQEEKKGVLGDVSSNLEIVEIDFTLEKAQFTIIDFLKKRQIQLSSIIHNARSLDFIKIEKDHTVSSENFAGELYMDVIFPYRLTMDLQKDGHDVNNVVFVSSMYGVVAPTPHLYEDFHNSSPIHYGVSKAAQIHLTKELAVRLAPKTRVNCVSFGGIKGRTDDKFLERYGSLNPQGKMIEEEDVIGPIDFLISEKSSDMTGQNLIVDGGWTIW